jgi:hypothetical protein
MWKGAGANVLRTIGSALVLILYGEIKTLLVQQRDDMGPDAKNTGH